MLKTPFHPFPVLHTTRLSLLPFHEGHADELHRLRRHPQVTKYLQRPIPATIEETLQNIQVNKDLVANESGIAWVIMLKESNQLVGVVGFWRMKKENYRAEVGYLMFPEYRGKGIMTEALQEVLRFAFEDMDAHSIEADIHPANDASAKILERNGFVREAYYRENFYFNNQFHDSAMYGLLRSDWLAAKQNRPVLH